MQGYLLDVNHIEAFFREEPSLINKIRLIPAERLLWVCSITLGEIEAGHRMTQTTNQVKRDEYIKFVHDKFSHLELEVTGHSREHYAEIIGRIWQNYPPTNNKKKTDHHLLDLGVDINDVWAVAVAWERGLAFVTSDRMTCIKDAVGAEVVFENWLL